MARANVLAIVVSGPMTATASLGITVQQLAKAIHGDSLVIERHVTIDGHRHLQRRVAERRTLLPGPRDQA